jgi:Ala-tRNA(Pro) deacylase
LSHADPAALFRLLADLGIENRTIEHEAVFTVEQSRDIKDDIAGGHSKNLFLKDKKGRLFLVVAQADTRIDLKRVTRSSERRAGCRSARPTSCARCSASSPGR